jgi:hypothetical protein
MKIPGENRWPKKKNTFLEPRKTPGKDVTQATHNSMVHYLQSPAAKESLRNGPKESSGCLSSVRKLVVPMCPFFSSSNIPYVDHFYSHKSNR